MTARRRSPNPIRVLEYGRVILPPDKANARTKERLDEAARKCGIPAFEIRGHNLYARGVVGVVDIGDIVVELLPKTHDQATAEEGRAFLTELLRFASAEKGLAAASGAIATDSREMLEVILGWAVRTAGLNMRIGLPRRYVRHEEVSATIRGRVDLRSVVTARPGGAFKLTIRYAPISENNTITQIVKWLLGHIYRITKVAATKSSCRGLLNNLDGASDIFPTPELFNSIVLQPLEDHWEPLLLFARSLAQQNAPDPTRAGSMSSVAVLFTLHDLFEAVLRRVFREGLPKHGLLLRSLGGHLLHPAHENKHAPLLRLRPDFVFKARDGGRPAIGDAKWKRILSSTQETRLSESDAYQLAAYVTALRGRCGFIFCPLSGEPDGAVVRILSWTLSGDGQPVHIVGVHLPTLISRGTEGDVLRATICRTITEAILPVAGAA